MTDDEIAKVADAFIQRVYIEIGKGVLKKALWIVGIGIVALWIWLGNHGFR